MSQSKPKIFCLGVSHHSANMEFRESLYIDEKKLGEELKIIKNDYPFKEVAILSTCNRFEMFGVFENDDRKDMVLEAFVSLQTRCKPTFPFSIDQVKENSFYLEEREAIEHVFTVVSSLDSVVLGETQITGQFKDSIKLAKSSSTLGPTLDRMAQEALAVTKKIRSQTAIGEKTVSISHTAIDLAKKVFVDLSQHNFLIIGAGEMAELAAKYATKYSPKSLMIANRTLSNAQKLVETVGTGTAYSIGELPQLLAKADVIISSTSASGFVITRKMVQDCLKQRKESHPLFFVDIALPRDIDPSCSDIDEIYLFEIDDLKQVVDRNIDERKQAAYQGAEMIVQHADQFVAWLDSHSIKPTLAKFRCYFETLVQQEAQKSLSKETMKDLNADQIKAIENLLSSIQNKILGDVSRSLKQTNDQFTKFDLTQALDTIFNLEKKEKS